MVIALVVVVAPFSWLVISSVADKADLLTKPLEWIPAHISLGRFVDLTVGSSADETAQGFRSAIMNSMVIASATTAVGMVVGTLAAYAFARLRFPGRGWMILAFMATTMLPPIALILPLFQIMKALGLTGHADRPDHHLLVVRDAVRRLAHARIHRDDPARARRCRPRRRLLAARACCGA